MLWGIKQHDAKYIFTKMKEKGETAMEIIRTTTQAEVRGCGTAHWAKQRE